MADKSKPIAVGADHLGLPLKNVIRDHLREQGYTVEDWGVHTDEPVDYPDIAAPLALAVSEGQYDRAILVCGTGAGMAIVANKAPGVRAVCVNDPYTAERARASNDAQIITLGALVTEPAVAKQLVDIWLASEFQSARSGLKVQKITEYEHKYADVALHHHEAALHHD